MILLSICLFASLTAQEKSLERIANETAQAGNDAFHANDFANAGVKYEEAVATLKQATEKDGIPLDQQKADQWLNIAYSSFVKAKQFEDAVRVLEKRMEFDPTNYSLVKQEALIYKKYIGSTEKAIDVLKAYDSKKQTFTNQKKIADYYVGMDDLENALIWFEKAYKIKQDSDVIKNIAVINKLLDRPDEAVQAYKDFLDTNPPQAVMIKTYKNMAILYEDLNNEAEMINYYRKANELKYDEQISILLMSKYYEQKDYSNTIKEADVILAKNSTQQDALYIKALSLYKNGDAAGAKTYFQKVTDPRFKKDAEGFIKAIESR